MYPSGLTRQAHENPDALALSDGVSSWTWAQLATEVQAITGHLTELVNGRDVRFGVTGHNVGATVIAHLAGLHCGVGTVALHREGTAAEIAHELSDAECTAVLTASSSAATVLAAARRASVDVVLVHGDPLPDDAPPEFQAWSEWTEAGPGSSVSGPRPSWPIMVYTSGTTGQPRATQVSWLTSDEPADAEAYLAAVASISALPSGPHLVVGPLQHNGPLTCLRHLLAGQPVIVMARFDAETTLRLIQQNRVTSTVMVPTHFGRLLALPPAVRERYDVTSLTYVAHTGSACPEQTKRRMIDWWGPVLVESYGGSEIGTVCRIDSAQWLAMPGSVGLAVPPLRIEAYRQDGEPMARGSIGLLGVTLPPGRRLTFHGDEEKSRRAYLRPDVVTLGDVGYVDPQGFVFITDRLADVVVSGGVNLYPAECERVLLQHPQVVEVAVIGIPEPDMGEALHALVVRSGDAATAEDVDSFCRARLSGPKCPRSYEFLDTLPRNEMGKVDKRQLRGPYWGSERTIGG